MAVLHAQIESALFGDPKQGYYLYSCRRRGSRSIYNRRFKAIYKGYSPPQIGYSYAMTGTWMNPDETEKKFVFRYYESLQRAREKHASNIQQIRSKLND